MRRKFLVSLVLVLFVGLSMTVSGIDNTVPIPVMQIAEKNLDSVKAFLEREYNLNPSASTSIGDIYNIYYLKKDFELMVEDSFVNSIYRSDDYLVVLNSQGHPFSYMQIGIQDGEYQLQMYGGNAQFIDTVKGYANKLNPRKLYLVAMGPNYQFLTDTGELYTIPRSELDNDKANSKEDANKVLAEVKEKVKQNNKKIENGEEITYGIMK